MSGRHVVGAAESHTAESQTDQPAEAPTADEAPQHPEPPEQYVEPVEEHEHTGTGPVQWAGGAESES